MKNLFDEIFEAEVQNDSINTEPYPDQKSNQEIAPAVAAAGAAVGALGYSVVKDLLNSGSSSDVTWKLKMMEGTKFPNNDKKKYQKIYGYKSVEPIRVKGAWIQGFWLTDEISATFQINFEYNNHSISNIYVENRGANDAVSWELEVNQDIRLLSQVFYVGSRAVAAADVKFHYHFHGTFKGSKILLITYRIYGNGYWKRTEHKWV